MLSYKDLANFSKPTFQSCMPCYFARLCLWIGPLEGFPDLNHYLICDPTAPQTYL